MKVIVNNPELAAVLNVRPGDVVDVPDRQGVPTNREWRNRLKDAEIDNCVTVVVDAPKRKGADTHASS